MFSQCVRTVAACAFTLCCGCQRYVFEFQADSSVKGTLLDLTVDRPSEADILFVIDNSGSMAKHQEDLKRNFPAFIDKLKMSPTQFQIGLTTTDNSCASDVPPANNPWDGLCGRLFSDDGTNPILRRADFPNDEAGGKALAARFNKLVGAIGTKGSGSEQGLKSAAYAVGATLTAPGQPNAGFVRPEALLAIIFVSDEWDCSYSDDPQKGSQIFMQSSLAAGQSCYEWADKLETVKNWAEKVIAVKGRASLVSASSITAGVLDGKTFKPSYCSVGADGNPTTACGCFYGNSTAFCKYTVDETGVQKQPSGVVACEGASCCFGAGCCTAMGSSRYQDFTNYFHLRYNDSICRNDYKQTLQNIAGIVQRDCFPLDTPPVAGQEDYVQVKRRAQGETEYTLMPQVKRADADAGIGDGWFLRHEDTTNGGHIAEICLIGSYKRVIGDSYKIAYITEVKGSGSDIPAAR